MKTTTKKLTTTAVLLALGIVLSIFTVFKLPNGGSVTIGSMFPIILIAMLYDTGWGILSALVFSALQIVTGGGVPAPPVQDFVSYMLVVILDYVIAFGVLGFAGAIYRAFKKRPWAIPLSTAIVVFLRFICHLLSGILIWKVYAPEGQSPFLYSLVYNGSYMGVELIITTILSAILPKFIKKLDILS